MEQGDIVKGLQEYPHLHVDVDEFSKDIIESYVNVLYDHIEKKYGVKENFCTFNDELLEAIAKAVSVIVYGVEQQSPIQVREFIKDGFIKKFNECYDIP